MRSPTTSTRTSTSASGTGTTRSSATDDRIFRTYFIDARGDEAIGTTWSYLDIAALGRQEEWEDSPEGYPQTAAVSGGGTTTTRTPADDRPRRRPAAGGDRAFGGRRGRRAAGGARLDSLAPATPKGAPDVTETITLRMERTYEAPAQAVFDAWTSEEVMRRWWHAGHDWETAEATVDLRIGGAVRVVMRDPHKDARYGGGGRLHRDRPAEEARVHLDLGRLPGQGTADRDRLRGARWRHHAPLHPQQPVGRGSGSRPRGRLGQGLRQPRARAREN